MPEKIGIDEFAQTKGHKNFATVISDIETGKPIKIINSRKQEKLIEVLSVIDVKIRLGVKFGVHLSFAEIQKR